MIIDMEILNGFESRYRALFINSLAGIRQAVLIGTKSKDGFSNLALMQNIINQFQKKWFNEKYFKGKFAN